MQSGAEIDSQGYGEFLTEEHQTIRQMVREFADKEIAPKAAQVDREAKFPAETFKALGK
jgi:alkylation response protein AidB-like acyl-CoA dehydrogenase